MNQDLINKINEAIKNNDMETIEQLKKDYNIQINVQRISDVNKINALKNTNNITGDTGNIKNGRLVSVTKIDPSKLVNNDSNNYFRDVPCGNDLIIIYFLASIHKLLEQESDIFGAFLLRWINEKKVGYVKGKRGFFRKNYTVFKFLDNIYIEDELEKNIYDFIKNISKDNILEVKEFHKWMFSHEYELNAFLNKLKMFSHDRMAKIGLVEVISNSSSDANSVNVINKNGSIRISSERSFRTTQKYHEYLQQIVDFKNFIKEFSLIHEKDVLEISLWGDYLAVSQLLGIADDVSKQLDDLVPGFRTRSKFKKKHVVKIKVPSNIPREQVNEYIRRELENRKNNK